MATGKRYYWIKLKESFLNSDAVDFLMSQPDGANYVVLYQILCLKTINTGGKLARQIGEIIIPYDEEKIQRDAKWFTIDTVRVALNLYKALGLIYTDENGVLALAEYENIVGSETSWKDQKKAQRAKNLPELNECKRLNANTLRLPSGKRQFVDEKRYGGNGMLAFDLAGGKCEMCGSYDDLLIHHANGYSNEPKDLYVLCTACHGKAHSPSTPPDWIHHTWVNVGQDGGQDGGQGGGHVHTDIDIRDRDKILDNNIIEEAAEPPNKPRKTRKKKDFVPPTVEEVSAHCKEKSYHFDPQEFVRYYNADDWHFKDGKKVSNWKLCCVTWENNWIKKHGNSQETKPDFSWRERERARSENSSFEDHLRRVNNYDNSDFLDLRGS